MQTLLSPKDNKLWFKMVENCWQFNLGSLVSVFLQEILNIIYSESFFAS